jgi:class 3 adenylate cyclase/tetratricopeptide (TPR) repeat protein
MNERESLEAALAKLEAQRTVLGDVATDAALEAVRGRIAVLSAEARPTDPDVAGERKVVTVMFADLSGFTSLSEKIDPEPLRNLVNDCFDSLVPTIQRYGGTVDKFIGDEIMALFGAPVAHENHAERALLAAIDLMASLEAFNATHRTSLRMHIGVNTGLVVAGGLGSEGQQRYSVVGDAVNLAARLEAAAETGQIVVGPDTHRLTKRLFEFEPLAPLALKGKAEPVRAYRLLRPTRIRATSRGIAGLESPLVGRHPELDRFDELVQAVVRGAGSIAAVTGEPGLGKSRLVLEVKRRSPPTLRWCECRALSYTSGTSYAVARDLLDRLIGIDPYSDAAEVASALHAAVATRFPDPVRFAVVHPYLARLRGVALDADAEAALQHVLPEALQQRMRSAFVELVHSLCTEAPLALVWEDLHWADPSSLGVLEALLPLTDDHALLALVVFRADDGDLGEWYARATAGRVHGEQPLALAPLAEEDSVQLVENLLRVDHLPTAIRELVIGKAEGNPFFVEELLRSLIDAGLLLIEAGRVTPAGRVEALNVPDTLQGVVAARVDRLAPRDKHTLQTAAVIGRVFQRPVLETVLKHNGVVEVDEPLRELQRRELVRLRSELEYIFKHAITQDVTYNSVLIGKRRELHRAIAEAIEALYADRVEDLAATLAFHYERADSPERAVHYLTLAADLDRRNYSNAEAIRFYRAAIEQAQRAGGNPTQLASLNESLADVLKRVGAHEEARIAYREALAHVAAEEVLDQARLLRKEGTTWMPTREFHKALETYALAEAKLPTDVQGGTPELVAEWLELQIDRSWAHYWAHDVPAMASLVERMRPVVERGATALQRAKFFRTAGLMAWRRDRWIISDQTLDDIRMAVDAARESGDRAELAFAVLGLGMTHLWRRKLDLAEEHLRRSLSMAEEIGDLERQILALTYLTVTLRCKPDMPETKALAERAMEASQRAGMTIYVGVGHANLAWAAYTEGKLAEAEEHARKAFELWGSVPNPGRWLAVWPLAGVLAARGDDGEACQNLGTILDAPNMRMPERLETLVRETLRAQSAGDASRCNALLRESIAVARETRWL